MKNKIKSIFMIMVLVLSMLVQSGRYIILSAAELKPEVTITNFTIKNLKTEYDSWEQFELLLDWDASSYNNTLVEGDYFEVGLPENMQFPNNHAATHFPLLDSENNTVANAVVTPNPDGGGSIKATFTNYVTGKHNIKGMMYLKANFVQSKLKLGEENTFKVVVGKTTKEIKVKIKNGIGQPKGQLDKWGGGVSGNDNQVQWAIRINHSQAELVGLKLSDTVLTGEKIDANSFYLVSAYWNKFSLYLGEKRIDEPLQCTVSPDGKSFTCDLSNVVPYIAETDANDAKIVQWNKSTRAPGDLTGATLFLRYKTEYQPGTEARNKVVGTSVTWSAPKENIGKYESASSGGTGEGNKGKVRIIKVDSVDPNIKLPQAKFEIRIKDTNQLIETLVTGDNGEAISKETLNPLKKYILKEISTPPGYEVSATSESLEFVPDLNKLTDVKAENKRILTNVCGEKKWESDEGYNVRPASVEIQLLADGVEVPGKKIEVKPDAGGNWKYEFKDLPKFRTDGRDKDGKDIPIVYSVKEVVVPEGYTSIVEGMNVKNVYTPKEYEFKFKKTDVAGAELPGATIVVTSVDGRPLIHDNGNKVESIEWVSDGTARELKLEPGKYKFEEKAAPEGYVLATTINFTLNPDGSVTGTDVKVEGSANIVTMVDDYKYHPITVSKVDLGGTELPGAKIVVKSADGSKLIQDEQNNAVSEVTWTSTDTAKELKLRAGKYVFHEEAAPNGYLTVTDIEFEVDKDGKVTVTKVAEDDIVKSEGGKLTITDRKVPEVKTEAKVNGQKEDAPTDKVVLTDVVKYKNLIVGKTYEAKLVWMDKETNQPFLVEGQQVTASKTFVADQAEGEVELSVTVDAKHFVKDVQLVAFEEVYKDNVLVAAHKEIDDADQTVKVNQPKPDLKTTAHVNGEKEAPAKDQLTLTDTVYYKNVVAGKEYTVKLVWMDKASGQPFLIEGQEITAEKTFTAKSSEGEIELSTVVDAKHFTTETTLVAFEKLLENGAEVGAHEEIDDVDQTVIIKENFNPLTISKTDLGGTELPGARITIKSADGSELISDNGQKVSSLTFESSDTAKEINVLPGKYVFHEEAAPNGYLTVTDIEFEVDKDGKVTVTKVAEDDIVKSEGGKITVADRKVPEVKTEAKVNGQKEDAPTDKVVLTDVVKYKNLIVGKTYVAKLVWMDQETNQPFLVEGQPITAEKTFTASTEEGEVELSVTVDAKYFVKDVKLVAFEEVYKDNVMVAAHKEIEDENQTVIVRQPKPGLKTEAKVNGKKEAILKGTVTLTDRVDYTNLVVGKEYTVKLVWMDKATGKEVMVDGKALSAEKTFIAKSSEGQIELSVAVEAKHLKQGKLVAFETLYEQGKEIGAHKDINDISQTVLVKKPSLPKTGDTSNTGFFAGLLALSCSVLTILGLKRRRENPAE